MATGLPRLAGWIVDLRGWMEAGWYPPASRGTRRGKVGGQPVGQPPERSRMPRTGGRTDDLRGWTLSGQRPTPRSLRPGDCPPITGSIARVSYPCPGSEVCQGLPNDHAPDAEWQTSGDLPADLDLRFGRPPADFFAQLCTLPETRTRPCLSGAGSAPTVPGRGRVKDGLRQGRSCGKAGSGRGPDLRDYRGHAGQRHVVTQVVTGV